MLPNKVETLPLKLALFNLQKYIKEEDFAVEFMLKGGVGLLVELVENEDPKAILTGNSLAVRRWCTLHTLLTAVRPARHQGCDGLRQRMGRLRRRLH